MPGPHPSALSPSAAAVLGRAWDLTSRPHAETLEVALTTALRNELVDELESRIGGVITSEPDQLCGLPVVIDDSLPPALGGYQFRNRRQPCGYCGGDHSPIDHPWTEAVPRPAELVTQAARIAKRGEVTVRGDQGATATVGHGDDSVALIVASARGNVGAIALDPAQARALACLLIEQARHAETALKADEEDDRG